MSAATSLELDPRVRALMADSGFGDLYHPHQHRCCVLVERYAQALAVGVARELGLSGALETPRTADAVADACGVAPAYAPALRWLLALLASDGLLESTPAGYVQRRPLPEIAPAPIRAQGLAEDASYEPAYALLDEAAALHPRVARGEAVAERALFLRVRLWQAYFSNANGYYALSNRVAARVAAARLAEAGGGPVLEVGAGLGSATDALLEALDGAGRLPLVGGYALTEPVPFFRRRAEQSLAARWPAVPIAASPLDVDGAWDATPPGGAALVWGVNVFHLARDLDATLRAAWAALRPGGWLVVGEGLRPRAGQPVVAELPFTLLASYAAVVLDAERRPDPGFLTAGQWRAALLRAGFDAVRLEPDAEQAQALSPVFLAAAACGRRPATARPQ